MGLGERDCGRAGGLDDLRVRDVEFKLQQELGPAKRSTALEADMDLQKGDVFGFDQIEACIELKHEVVAPWK